MSDSDATSQERGLRKSREGLKYSDRIRLKVFPRLPTEALVPIRHLDYQLLNTVA